MAEKENVWSSDQKFKNKLIGRENQKVTMYRRTRFGGWAFCLKGIWIAFLNGNGSGKSTAIIEKEENENEVHEKLRIVEIDEKNDKNIIFSFSPQ